MNGELSHKNQSLDKENRKLQKIEEELKDRKKEHAKLMKEIAKLEQQLKESVRYVFVTCIHTIAPLDPLKCTGFQKSLVKGEVKPFPSQRD